MAVFAHEMKVGDAYAPLDLPVSAELNEQFLFSLGLYHRRYTVGSAGRAPLVHPVILLNYTPRTRSPSFKLAPGMGSVFLKDRTEFLAPVRVGDVLRVTWIVDAVYDRKGRIVQEYTAKAFVGSTQTVDRKMMSVFTVGAVS